MAEPSYLVAIEQDGETDVHAIGCDGSDYASLCGMDGTDEAVGQRIVSLGRRRRITCQHCIAIIEHAWSYERKDISRG